MIINFLKTFSVLNSIDGETIVEESPVIDETVGAEDDLPTQASSKGNKEVTLSDYLGSKDVNPEQLPLKKFNRDMFTSKSDFDEFLAAVKDGGEDIFAPPADESDKSKRGPGRPKKAEASDSEKIIKKVESETGKKPSDKTSKKDNEDGMRKGKSEGDSETDVDAKQGKDGKGKKEGGEVEAEKFLEDLGISIEEFQGLPEKVQEKLTADDSGVTIVEQKYKKLQDEHTGLINDVVKLKNDPVIAARIEEKNTGKAFVARDLPPISKKEAADLLTLAENPDEFSTAVNELIVAKAHEVLTIERGVIERNALKTEREKKAAEVLQDVVKREPRIGITEKDISKLADEGHPEHDKFFGAGSLMEMMKRKKYSPSQIIEKGADEILEEYAKTKGWDQEKIAKIEKNAKQSLLESLRSFKKVARVLDVGKRPVAQISSDGNTGFDKESLIAEIASGKTGRWSKLISDFNDQGDNTIVDQLTEIYEEGLRQRRTQ
jgi:hypothetical protein